MAYENLEWESWCKDYTTLPKLSLRLQRQRENIKGKEQLPNTNDLDLGVGLVTTQEIVIILEILLLEGKHKTSSVWDL